MISETEQARNNLDLEFLQGTLKDKADLPVSLIYASEGNPLPSISGAVPTTTGLAATFQLLFIPTKDSLEEVNLLQIFIYSQDKLNEPTLELYEFVRQANSRSLMGFFGIEDEEKRIFHRYVFTIPRFIVPNEAVFLETLSLCFGNFDSIANIILALAKRDYSLQEATEKLNN